MNQSRLYFKGERVLVIALDSMWFGKTGKVSEQDGFDVFVEIEGSLIRFFDTELRVIEE